MLCTEHGSLGSFLGLQLITGPGPKKPRLAAQAHDMVSVGAPGTADASGPPDLSDDTCPGEGG